MEHIVLNCHKRYIFAEAGGLTRRAFRDAPGALGRRRPCSVKRQGVGTRGSLETLRLEIQFFFIHPAAAKGGARAKMIPEVERLRRPFMGWELSLLRRS